MKLKLLLFATMILNFCVVQAQNKISGRVTDLKGHPVLGASIVLKDSYDGATSDSLGNYSFSTAEKGDHMLEVSINGYNSITQKININNLSIVQNVSLKEQITELKAVIISAGTFEASDKNKGAVLSSID